MRKKREKYGVVTAVAMMVGSVIGSGVFFKAEVINRITYGNLACGIAAWGTGGAVMLVCLLNFAQICKKTGKTDGLCGYARATTGESYSYYIGWFMMMLYYPSMVSVLARLSAGYTLMAFGINDSAEGAYVLLSYTYLSLAFALNVLSPYIAGQFQVLTTFIKLIPLVLMTVFGFLRGIAEDNVVERFSLNDVDYSALFSAVTASAFAYDGWIAATNISNRMKKSAENFPKALITGGIIISAIYMLYYTGVSIAAEKGFFLRYPSGGVRMIYESVFGHRAGTLLMIFVAVSCIGALNGLMYGCIRGAYFVSLSGNGPAPKLFSSVNPATKTPVASSLVGFLVSAVWLFFCFENKTTGNPLFGIISFDSSELTITTLYAMYIPVFFSFAKTHFKEKGSQNLLLPVMGIVVCALMSAFAFCAHRDSIVNYLCLYVSIMLAGSLFSKKERNP